MPKPSKWHVILDFEPGEKDFRSATLCYAIDDGRTRQVPIATHGRNGRQLHGFEPKVSSNSKYFAMLVAIALAPRGRGTPLLVSELPRVRNLGRLGDNTLEEYAGRLTRGDLISRDPSAAGGDSLTLGPRAEVRVLLAGKDPSPAEISTAWQYVYLGDGASASAGPYGSDGSDCEDDQDTDAQLGPHDGPLPDPEGGRDDEDHAALPPPGGGRDEEDRRTPGTDGSARVGGERRDSGERNTQPGDEPSSHDAETWPAPHKTTPGRRRLLWTAAAVTVAVAAMVVLAGFLGHGGSLVAGPERQTNSPRTAVVQPVYPVESLAISMSHVAANDHEITTVRVTRGVTVEWPVSRLISVFAWDPIRARWTQTGLIVLPAGFVADTDVTAPFLSLGFRAYREDSWVGERCFIPGTLSFITVPDDGGLRRVPVEPAVWLSITNDGAIHAPAGDRMGIRIGTPFHVVFREGPRQGRMSKMLHAARVVRDGSSLIPLRGCGRDPPDLIAGERLVAFPWPDETGQRRFAPSDIAQCRTMYARTPELEDMYRTLERMYADHESSD